MGDYVARERLYHTLDRSEVVKEGDPKAAFLIAAEGDVIPESEAKRLHLESHLASREAVDPNERTKARLEDALERGALYEAQSLSNAVERSELAEKVGVPERAVLEEGRHRSLTGAVPTPPASSSRERAARRESSAPARAESTAPASASASTAPAASSGGAKR